MRARPAARLASFVVLTFFATFAILALADSASAAPVTFRLPWEAGESLVLTQDGDDPCCHDHVGPAAKAFDFARLDAQPFAIVAPADGIVVQLKLSSHHGCPEASCVNEANYLVIAHDDGTSTTMLHLASAPEWVRCGERVRAGVIVGVAGDTGLASGVHLHIERDRLPSGARACACGLDGLGCAADEAHFELFFPTAERPNLPLTFQEWPEAMAFAGRRVIVGPSRNADRAFVAGDAAPARSKSAARKSSGRMRLFVALTLAAGLAALVALFEHRLLGTRVGA